MLITTLFRLPSARTFAWLLALLPAALLVLAGRANGETSGQMQDDAPPRPLARFVTASEVGGDVNALLQRVLETLRFNRPLPETETDAEDDERRLRRLTEAALEALSTEGFFSARIDIEPDTDEEALNRARYVLRVEPGPRTRVAAVEIVLRGAIEQKPERKAELISSWELPAGEPFRNTQWNNAKTRLLARMQARDFAAARLVDSQADINVDLAEAKLRIEIDSGPAFTLGELRISGLQRYEPKLVERYNTITPGDPYDAEKLLEFQRALQASSYFGSVLIDVDTDPAKPDNVPIRVELTEAKTKRFSIGTGYSTNTRQRIETTYRQALIFGLPYTFQSGIGWDTTRRVAYGDILLPPKPDGALDSSGVLGERTDIQNVLTRAIKLGVSRARSWTAESINYETKTTLKLQRELRRISTPELSGTQDRNDVLSLSYDWTRNNVDQITDPRRGAIMRVLATPGLSRSNSIDNLVSESFVQLYGRYQRYISLSRRDVIILRGEAGHVIVDEVEAVPNEFLFRAGGAGSVRGYSYQSLGSKQGLAVRGSRSLIVGSAEYVRWFSDKWGGAVFYDVGDADDELLRVSWAKGYGAGLRWKTLAGPLALDVAYGERQPDRRWRVHFAIAIAF